MPDYSICDGERGCELTNISIQISKERGVGHRAKAPLPLRYIEYLCFIDCTLPSVYCTATGSRSTPRFERYVCLFGSRVSKVSANKCLSRKRRARDTAACVSFIHSTMRSIRRTARKGRSIPRAAALSDTGASRVSHTEPIAEIDDTGHQHLLPRRGTPRPDDGSSDPVSRHRTTLVSSRR